MFAPELAAASGDYEARFFDCLFTSEPKSFWFRSRNALIGWMLRKVHKPPVAVMEIGCGTGFTLEAIAKTFPDTRLTATDVLPEAFDYARRRVEAAEYLQVDVTHLPFTSEFDVICALDVIEHIEDDRRALAEIHRALNSNGYVLITVPQHQSLWSVTDELAHHKRRYSRKELRDKLVGAGFDIVRMTSFVALLVPLLFLARRRVKTYDDAVADLQLARPIDALLGGVMWLERALIAAGIRFPFGGSLIVLARKNERQNPKRSGPAGQGAGPAASRQGVV